MAAEEHKYVRIERGDLVIISARVIPGNERTIGRVVNALYRLGAEVLYEDNAFVHVSGHASQEDLKMMINLTRPRYFVPVHGEYRHLLSHARLAESVGIDADRVFLIEDGVGVEASKSEARVVGPVSGRPHPRRLASRSATSARWCSATGSSSPRTASSRSRSRSPATAPWSRGRRSPSRGFVYVKENEPLLEELKKAVLAALAERDPDVPFDRDITSATVRMAVRQFVNQRFRRRPVVLPIILEV
jgi:ribonuclease J